MDYFQYQDIPQIPGLEEHYLYFTTHEHFNQSHTPHFPARQSNFYRETFNENEASNNIMLDMPLQRFLHDLDPSPLPQISYANLNRTPFQNQLQLERPWPSSDPFYSSRNGSPDRNSMSSTSNHAQNELNSPLPNINRYGSPVDYTSHNFSISSSPELMADRGYPAELPLPGNSINLRDLEIHHSDPETTAVEDTDHIKDPIADHVDAKSEYDYMPQDHQTFKAEPAMESHTEPEFKPSYPDSVMDTAMPVAEEVQPISPCSESDSDYKPSKKRRRSASTRSRTSRKSSTSISSVHAPCKVHRKQNHRGSISSPTRVTSKTSSPKYSKSHKSTTPSAKDTDSDARPFPCPLAAYGCRSDFASKNEWKRHVGTQHIKLGYWRCDLCATTVHPKDEGSVYHNDFNRKDLFTQHLRRMHAAPNSSSSPSSSKSNLNGGTGSGNGKGSREYPVTEANLAEHQTRCYRTLRKMPEQSSCIFCPRKFSGEQSWEERMEHVGRHFEKERGAGRADWRGWIEDEVLEGYLVGEGLVERDEVGGWRIGDGRPRRDVKEE